MGLEESLKNFEDSKISPFFFENFWGFWKREEKKQMATRILRGGSTPKGRVFVGPVVAVAPYNTVRGGMADEISAKDGEVLAKFASGSPEEWARWVAGPLDEVKDFLLTSGKLPREHGEDLIQELDQLLKTAPTTPVGALAQALGLEAGTVSHAAELAGVDIVRKKV